MDLEESIRKLDHYIGKQVQVIAFGTSYLGNLESVDHQQGYIIISDGKDRVNIDMERIESFTLVEGPQ